MMSSENINITKRPEVITTDAEKFEKDPGETMLHVKVRDVGDGFDVHVSMVADAEDEEYFVVLAAVFQQFIKQGRIDIIKSVLRHLYDIYKE